MNRVLAKKKSSSIFENPALQEQESFVRFVETIHNKYTKRVYLRTLFECLTHTQFRSFDEVTQIPAEELQNRLENWVRKMIKTHPRAETVREKLNGIVHFAKMNKLLINKDYLRGIIPKDLNEKNSASKPYTTSDIRLMLNHSTNPRQRMIVHFFASTGARPNCVQDPPIRMKHIKEMPYGCKAVRIYDGSIEAYWAFLTPEASECLDSYLEYRKNQGEELTEESPLFKANKGGYADYMTHDTMRTVFGDTLVRAGVKRKKIEGERNYDKPIFYAFRYRFNSILKLDSDVNDNIAEKLMAHKRGLDGSYLKPTVEECFEEFYKAVPELSINDTSKAVAKIAQLEQENTLINELKEEVNELRKFREQFKGLKLQLSDFEEKPEEPLILNSGTV